MIKDAKFKKLNHFYKGFLQHSNGQEIEKGYKPDYVLRKGNKFVILECEINSSRKAFVGAMIKAAYFLTRERSGMLVIVMHKKDNTTVEQIANHLRPYYRWLKTLTNLSTAYVIEAKDYCHINKCLVIKSPAFTKQAIKL